MKSISDFNIWIEEILVGRGWDVDDPEVFWCITRFQDSLMAMYAGDIPEIEVARYFAKCWHTTNLMGDPE
jgi:hypothetical protein